ncbi:nucleotidyltransferase domain-containing protein [Bacillus horti]|uniref:Nucleotidyltransferase n=1 Tax=Caldalkalibacillus horti TaxID=77523 RepID=A0ABT9VZG1_9BACI|nr:nucleotidyltransferase domain-containing protein [Bacillus horti]MDQ0166362.1 putative nucleotidyltransferase [Bacillus horti]
MEDTVLKEICAVARRYGIKEDIVLFGSRARGDHSAVSDYDIAVFQNTLNAKEKALFYMDLEDIETLKKIDVVFINEQTDKELLKSIEKEGVSLHE